MTETPPVYGATSPSDDSSSPDVRRISLDLPAWMACRLDAEAARIGLPREALLRLMVYLHLKNGGTGTG